MTFGPVHNSMPPEEKEQAERPLVYSATVLSATITLSP